MLAKGQLYLSPLATKNRVDNGGGELDASQSPLELQLSCRGPQRAISLLPLTPT